MRYNVLQKRPNSNNRGAAIAVCEEGALQPTRELIVVGNRFANDQSRTTVLVRNLTTTPADLRGNVLNGPGRALAASRYSALADIEGA